ncbi:MAG: family 20 glycosylhydrolase [Phycisphaeraceae bacterium]|nr:family 20 glycosylhydrolase [Phycisphaeraceae bacterium]
MEMSPSFEVLFPLPAVREPQPERMPLGSALDARMPPAWRGPLAAQLASLARHLHHKPDGVTRIDLRQTDVAGTDRTLDERYEIRISPGGVTIDAAEVAGIRCGLNIVEQLCRGDAMPCGYLSSTPKLRYRGIQIDLGRVIERPDTVLSLLHRYAGMGYNVLQFYLEDAFRFDSHPKLARHRAWTLEQTLPVVDAAGRLGMTVIPAIQSLGHCAWVGHHPDYRELDEGREREHISGVLCPSHPRTQEMLHQMIRDVAPLATSGIIHLGMDESMMIGQCPLCSPRRKQIGEGGIFVQHANFVAGCVAEVGCRPGIWSDMFYYYPDAAAQLDKRVLLFDWYYYVFPRTPRVELYNFADFDTMALWKKHGLEAWGCPSSVFTTIMPINDPAECVDNARSWQRYLLDNHMTGMMVTQWELSKTNIRLSSATEGAMAEMFWTGTDTPTKTLLEDSCRHLYGKPELADILLEIGRLRIHGSGAMRWTRAASVASMVSGHEVAEDKRRAQQVHALRQRLVELLDGEHPDHAAILAAARWLSYQYDKRWRLNEASMLAGDRKYQAAAAVVMPLPDEARQLAGQLHDQWNHDRYADDNAPTPAQLRKEADLLDAEIARLQSPDQQAGCDLARPVLIVDVLNSSPALPKLEVSVSADGRQFTKLDDSWLVQFNSASAQPVSEEVIRFSFPLQRMEDANYVRAMAVGAGGFTFKAACVVHGSRRMYPKEIVEAGDKDQARGLLVGRGVVLGAPDLQRFFRQCAEEGDTGKVFAIRHQHVTVKMG